MTTRLEQAADKAEIHELESRYEWAVDEGDLSGLAEVFARDATLWFDRVGRTISGRDAILEWFKEYIEVWNWRNRRHYVTNFEVRIRDSEASGRLYYLATYEADGASRLGWGNYHDTFIRSDGRWWISSKRISSVGVIDLDKGWAGIDQIRPSGSNWQ